MKFLSWEKKLGITLVLISAIVYTLKFMIPGDIPNTLYYVFNVINNPGGSLHLGYLYYAIL